jgi:hypothetical protein
VQDGAADGRHRLRRLRRLLAPLPRPHRPSAELRGFTGPPRGEALRERLRRRLGPGPIRLHARAWAVRGFVNRARLVRFSWKRESPMPESPRSRSRRSPRRCCGPASPCRWW